jgi:5-methylcytosine-specific restriction endonuclease McrA
VAGFSLGLNSKGRSTVQTIGQAIGQLHLAMIRLALALLLVPSAAFTAQVEELESRGTPASPFWVLESQFGHKWASREIPSLDRLSQGAVNLLDYLRSKVKPFDPSADQSFDRYNRLRHFGGWARPDPNDCKNTRALVLIRNASPRVEIEYRAGKECVVQKASWKDPFTGDTFKLANALDIDHIVPLKNAYVSGAHSWEASRRCHYANYLEAEYHLLPVSGSENKSKGERPPDKYMPPNERFHCRYLSTWMRIKTIWELDVTPEEYQAIRSMLLDKGCRASDFQMPASELKRHRINANQPIEVCESFGRRQVIEQTASHPPQLAH